jgi:pyruvate formate lyase activating enzyme
MIIRGLQKTTLLDFPNKVACTVFLGGCNFRCPFCHNSSLVRDADGQSVAEENFFDFLQKRKGLIDGVCVTGGEPTLTDGLDSFLKRIKDAGFLVKLDTNGSFPEKLEDLIDRELVDYAAMDIKNSLESYKKTVGTDLASLQKNKSADVQNSLSTHEKTVGIDLVPPQKNESADIKNSLPTHEKNIGINCNLDAIQKSASILMKNKVDFEFRTTVVKELHAEDDMKSIGKWLKGGEKYYLQYFKPSKDTISQDLTPPTDAEMKAFRDILAAYIPNVKIR